jgi:hypothetical protein
MLFYNSFFYSSGKLENIPDNFRLISNKFNIFVHQDNKEHIIFEDDNVGLFLLGNIFDPTILEHSRVKICKELLQLLTINEQKMIEKINKLIGRFVIIYYKNDMIYLINDASGMRSVFYGVINDNFYCSSHAYLIAVQNKIILKNNTINFSMGYPGLRTPYKNVYMHNPSYKFNLRTYKKNRIFPYLLEKDFEIKDIAKIITNRAKNVLKKISNQNNESGGGLISLTAGHDSRTTLSFAMEFKDKFDYFTYVSKSKPAFNQDALVAQQLAKKYALNHKIINMDNTSEMEKVLKKKLLEEIAKYTYYSHGYSLALRYYLDFKKLNKIHIRSNLFEILRTTSADKKAKKFNINIKNEVEMAQIYQNRPREKIDSTIVEIFKESYFEDELDNKLTYDLRDRYAMEHIHPAWLSMFLLESDIAFDTIILINSREIFNLAMSIPKEVRMKNELINAIINMNCPSLLDIPFN